MPLVFFVILGTVSLYGLGGNDLKSVVRASLYGIPLPLCSCSVIPTATSLKRSGASKGAFGRGGKQGGGAPPGGGSSFDDALEDFDALLAGFTTEAGAR